MKAIQIKKHGDASILECSRIDEPSCPDDKVKVKIEACSVNHLDIWVRSGIPGLKLPLPLILGSDGSGVIVEVGDNIKSFNIVLVKKPQNSPNPKPLNSLKRF